MKYYLIKYLKDKEICITGIKYINTDEKIDESLYIECSYSIYKYIKDLSKTFDVGLNFIRTKETNYISDIKQLYFIEGFKDKLEQLNMIKKSFKLKAKKLLDSRMKDDFLDMAIYNYFMTKYTLDKKYSYTSIENLVEQVVLSDNKEDEANLSLFIEAIDEMNRKKNWFDMYVSFCKEIATLDSKEKIEIAYKEFNEKFF